MSVGLPVDKNVIDSRVGNLVWQLRDQLEAVQRVKDWLDATPDADLIAMNYTAAEVATLKSAFTDLSNLGKIAHGESSQASANDFFFWADHLTGLQ